MDNELNQMGNQMTEEEMRADLENDFSNLDEKNSALEGDREASKEESKNREIEILKKFYGTLEEKGVDLNDMESISRFLQELRETDPDFYELIEKAFASLSLGAEEGGMQVPGAPEAGMPTPGGPAGMQMPSAPAGMQMPGAAPASMPTPEASAGGLTDKFSDLQNNVLRK